MPGWQRVTVTLATVALITFLGGLLWREIFDKEIPSYYCGVLGAVVALPLWEALKLVGLRPWA